VLLLPFRRDQMRSRTRWVRMYGVDPGDAHQTCARIVVSRSDSMRLSEVAAGTSGGNSNVHVRSGATYLLRTPTLVLDTERVHYVDHRFINRVDPRIRGVEKHCDNAAHSGTWDDNVIFVESNKSDPISVS